jgi:hypothetical protein
MNALPSLSEAGVDSACGRVMVSCSQGSLPVAIASVALVVAIVSAYFVYRKNKNDLSTPWVTLLLRYIEAELKGADLHSQVFRQICSTPFPSVTRKRAVVQKLYEHREESSRSLAGLCALVPAAKRLRDKRAALDGVADSYFDNDALHLPSSVAKDLEARYSEMHAEYLHELKRCAGEIWKRETLF